MYCFYLIDCLRVPIFLFFFIRIRTRQFFGYVVEMKQRREWIRLLHPLYTTSIPLKFKKKTVA